MEAATKYTEPIYNDAVERALLDAVGAAPRIPTPVPA
jgi:hypothetical protein